MPVESHSQSCGDRNFFKNDSVVPIGTYYPKGDVMKTVIKTIVLISCVLLFTAGADAQSKKRESSSQRDLGERIESIVDDVLAMISKGFTRERDDEVVLADTVKPKRAKKEAQESRARPVRQDNTLTYEGNVVIEEGDTVEANVVVKAGDLTVYGTIVGDALVVGGDLYVEEGGHITGNAKVINGEVIKDEAGRIDGYIDKTSSTANSYRETEKKFTRSSTRLNANWVSETTNLDNFIFRYNRVEGLFLGLGSDKRYYWDGQKSYSTYGSFGYGFKARGWRGNLGLSRQFTFNDGQLIEVGVEGHNVTDTKDNWIIGLSENTAAAILIHEDYRDYFRRTGFAVNAGYAIQQDYVTGQVRAEYLIDDYKSMENRTEWSIFGGNKKFRFNPPIDEGKMHSILTSAGLSTVTKTLYGPEGWSIFATAEFADRDFGGDFNFNQYVLDVRRYQPLGRYENLNLRLRVGTTEGTVPAQKVFEIGGLSTLNAFPFKSDAGNRMILANAEFIINGDFLGDLAFWPSWLMRGINFIVLGDAGLVRSELPAATWTEGFGTMKLSDFKHDLGVGVASRSGSFRLAFVWRTDRAEPARFIFRFARPF